MLDDGCGDHEALFDPDPATMPLGRLIAVVGAHLGRASQRIFADYGASPTAVALLSALGTADGLSHRAAARQLWLTPATLTPVVDTLEQAGHLQRRRDPTDRRVVRLHRTEAGAGWLRATHAAVSRRFGEHIPVPPRGAEPVLRGYLLEVLAALEANEKDGDP